MQLFKPNCSSGVKHWLLADFSSCGRNIMVLYLCWGHISYLSPTGLKNLMQHGILTQTLAHVLYQCLGTCRSFFSLLLTLNVCFMFTGSLLMWSVCFVLFTWTVLNTLTCGYCCLVIEHRCFEFVLFFSEHSVSLDLCRVIMFYYHWQLQTNLDSSTAFCSHYLSIPFSFIIINWTFINLLSNVAGFLF